MIVLSLSSIAAYKAFMSALVITTAVIRIDVDELKKHYLGEEISALENMKKRGPLHEGELLVTYDENKDKIDEYYKDEMRKYIPQDRMLEPQEIEFLIWSKGQNIDTFHRTIERQEKYLYTKNFAKWFNDITAQINEKKELLKVLGFKQKLEKTWKD